ncbi:MAG: winged helix-turn-helix domain-containing protein [Rhodospirillales bacterium]|nr:winged helix-turn-helix domain-containing protein [Rhodospirillales bacterium]
MIEPAADSPAGGDDAGAVVASRERTFRVLTTGEVRDRHAALLRRLSARVAVEEVADIPAVLRRLGEAPPPHLLVLGWNGDAVGDLETVRSLHAHPSRVPLFIVQHQPEVLAGQAWGTADDSEEVDVVRDAVLRLVASIGSLVSGTPDPDRRSASVADVPSESPLELRRDECRALWRGRVVNLSLTEFRIVARLVAEAGAEISHRDLYDTIKGEGFVAGAGEAGYRSNVRATIKRIRQKFRQADPGFEAIRNYPGFGYRWVVDVAAPAGPVTGARSAGL